MAGEFPGWRHPDVGTVTRRPDTLLPDAGSPKAQKLSMPSAAYSLIRAATVGPSPTSAVPAPPRTKPTPAHKLGLISRLSRLPLCSAAIRCCPTESVRANEACALAIVSSSRCEINRSAACHASSLVSRTITCRRIPKRILRPCAAAFARTCSIFSLPVSVVRPR